MNQITNLVKGK